MTRSHARWLVTLAPAVVAVASAAPALTKEEQPCAFS